MSFLFCARAFIAARTFTTFYPSTVLVSNGIHVHHFWYGIALLAIGGGLGIGYDDGETDRVAAVLYGVGGGLIVDEVGARYNHNDLLGSTSKDDPEKQLLKNEEERTEKWNHSAQERKGPERKKALLH